MILKRIVNRAASETFSEIEEAARFFETPEHHKLTKIEEFRARLQLSTFWAPSSIAKLCADIRTDSFIREFVLPASMRFYGYCEGVIGRDELTNLIVRVSSFITKDSSQRLGEELTQEYKPAVVASEPLWLQYLFLFKLFSYAEHHQPKEEQ